MNTFYTICYFSDILSALIKGCVIIRPGRAKRAHVYQYIIRLKYSWSYI